MMKEVYYNTIRGQIQTGDLLLFDGTSLVSGLIKFLSRRRAKDCPYKLLMSHIASTFVLGGNVFTWESFEQGKHKGVQMELLSQRLLSYKGNIYYRPLVYDRDVYFYNAYTTLREEWKNRKYEQNLLELLGALMPWKNTEDFSSIFCSELKAGVDKASGILITNEPANEFVPNDYLPECKVDSIMKASQIEAYYGEIIRILPEKMYVKIAA